MIARQFDPEHEDFTNASVHEYRIPDRKRVRRQSMRWYAGIVVALLAIAWLVN